MQRSTMNVGDPVLYPDFSHGVVGPLLKGTILAIPSDPSCRVTIRSAKGYPVRRLDIYIHPVGEVIPDDQCPSCDERPTERLYSRFRGKRPQYYCAMCKKSYEPKGQPIMEMSMIDVTGIDLVEFAKAVYDLSLPKGMGHLHYNPEPLSDEEAKGLVASSELKGHSALSMDYVKGRCCKMHVSRHEGQLEISDNWYDHTDAMFDKLLERFGLNRGGTSEHGCACECDTCRASRTMEKA